MTEKIKMTDKQYENFGKKFIERYLAYGFGSMTKSEIDTLVFHLISGSEGINGESNYHIANRLQITESRVKALRMNAALKYNQANHKNVLAVIVKRYIDALQKTDFEGGVVAISLENPVEQRELEHAVKLKGEMIEYGINREILKISPLALFELVVSVSADSDKDLKKIVQANIQSKEKQNQIFNSTLTFRQKINKIGEEINDKEGIITLLKGASLIVL